MGSKYPKINLINFEKKLHCPVHYGGGAPEVPTRRLNPVLGEQSELSISKTAGNGPLVFGGSHDSLLGIVHSSQRRDLFFISCRLEPRKPALQTSY